MLEVLILAERIFTVLALVLFTGGPLNVILSGGVSEGDIAEGPADFPQLQILFLLIYLVTLVLLTLRWKKTLYVLNKAIFIWLLIGIPVASILWSSTPAVTTIRSFVFVGTSLFGLYLAARYSLKEQLKLLMWTFVIVVGLSLLFAVVLPTYGIMGGVHAGAWRGIYTHKNVFGKIMVLSVLVFWLQATTATTKRWVPWLGLGLSVCCVFLAKSTTSIINMITLFTLVPTFRWRYHLLIPAVTAIATAGASLSFWATTNTATLLGTVGKDSTLTGRTNMWPYIWEMIEKQPWLGYGYDGFWQGWNSPAAYVWWAVNWTTPNAHNGFLNLLLELGIVGISVFLFGFGITLLRGLIWLRQSKSSESFWPLLYLTYIVLTNLSESSLLERNNIFSVLYVALAFSLGILPQEQSKILPKMST
jgi:exopolysaccharide production protein ExoQ